MSREFTKPWVLLCEGEADKRFFDRLISMKAIDSEFDVRFPSRDNERTGGRSKFGKWLDLHNTTNESFISNVKAVLVVSDNDDNMARSFREVQTQIRKAEGFPIPRSPQTLAKIPGLPAVVILMIPIGRRGNLETLCLEAAANKWRRLTNALDTFVAACPAKRWRLSKRCKMRLQTTLSATCKTRPDTSFAQHWHEDSKYHIPLNNKCFDSIVDFLMGFGTLVSRS